MEVKLVVWCSDCEVEVNDPQTIYECGNCGTQFTQDESNYGNHQCPDCNKFSAKLYDEGCPDCHGEVQKEERFFCDTCEEYFENEDEATEHEKEHLTGKEETNVPS